MKLEDVLPALREGKTIWTKERKTKFKMGAICFLDGYPINCGKALFEYDEAEKEWDRVYHFGEAYFFCDDWEVIENPIA
jgi:hypothetical protein